MHLDVMAQSSTITVAPAGWGVVVATAFVALLITVVGFVPEGNWWRRGLTSLHVLSTIVHETGHAAMSIVTGGGVYVIRIEGSRSGMTRSWVRSRLSSIVRIAAGYAAPPLAGLGIAALVSHAHAHTALALTAAAMVLVLTVSRDGLTVVSVLGVGFVAFAAAYWGSAGVQQWVAYTEAWLLLLCEIVGLWVLVSARIAGVELRDDAEALADETHIPSLVWILAWYALNGWALWIAVPLLLP